MHSKYVYLIIIFTLGFLTGRMSEDAITTTKDNDNKKSTLDIIVEKNSPITDSNNKVDGDTSSNLESSATLINPTQERFKGLYLEDSSQQDSDWQRILYETDDLDLKLAAISNLVSDDATEALAIGLGDSSALVRQKTIIGLGVINTNNSLRMVGQTLFSDRSIENRLEAISILEKNFDMPFVEYFLTFAMNHDQDATVRQRAATSLGL